MRAADMTNQSLQFTLKDPRLLSHWLTLAEHKAVEKPGGEVRGGQKRDEVRDEREQKGRKELETERGKR